MKLLIIDDLDIGPGRVDQPGHVIPVLGHDQLQRVLVLFKGCPELLVLLLQGPDVSVLLLDAEHQLGPGTVVCHLIEVLHVLLILPHGIHLLQYLLGPGNRLMFSILC